LQVARAYQRDIAARTRGGRVAGGWAAQAAGQRRRLRRQAESEL